MMRRAAGIAALAAGLALLPGAARADLRIEERSTALDSTVNRWIFIKGDRRSIVSRAEVSGVLYHAGARHGAYVEIARPDRELIWELDPQERSYREIPFSQFSRLLQKGVQAPRTSEEQPLRTLYRSETTAIEVVPTGKTKRIAGLPAEEVVARVVVGATNLVSSRKFIFTFDQQIWLTKDPQVMQELEAFEEAYVERFGTAASLQQVQLLAGPWNDSFINHLRAVNDRVRALKGFPLAVTTTVTEAAVAQEKNEKGNTRKITVGSSEVRKISFETIPDREFELPVGYINADTKVAVAAPLPVPDATPPAPAPVAEAPAPAPEKPAAEKPEEPVVAPAPAPAAPPAPAPVVARNNPPAPSEGSPSPAAAPAPPTARPMPTARPAPGPAIPVVTAPPSNVIVKGAPAPLPRPVPTLAKNAPVQEGVQDSPVLQYLLAAPTQNVPTRITVEEPEQPRRKKRKSLPF
jgi:hypothetical protein